jgi:hypothetical protein
MEAVWEPIDSELWERSVPTLVERIRADAPRLSELIGDRIAEAMPELLADPDVAAANSASNSANVSLLADLLERGADPAGLDLPEPTVAYATLGAHQNTPLPPLLRAYRLGHEAVWQEILKMIREMDFAPEDRDVIIQMISVWLFAYVDAASVLAEIAYSDERERWIRTVSASRAETIAAILAGEEIDIGSASARLGYELDRNHLAFIAWFDDTGSVENPLNALELAIAKAAESASLGAPIIHVLGLGAVAGWVGATREIGEAASLAASDLGESPEILVAIGEPARGLAGFHRTYREAMAARRVAGLLGYEAGTVTRYGEVALTAMATVDLDQATHFVERQLGELAGDDTTASKLIVTVAAYLDEGSSPGRAAHRLGIHENTVRYRIRQAEEALGRSIESGDLDLRVALTLAPLSGSGQRH